jgi:hypothetical protein
MSTLDKQFNDANKEKPEKKMPISGTPSAQKIKKIK